MNRPGRMRAGARPARMLMRWTSSSPQARPNARWRLGWGMVGLPAAAIEAMRGGPGWADRVALVHTWPREIREVALLSPDLSPLQRIIAPALLLDGEMSPAHHRHATAAIAATLPNATVTELPGQAHT